MSATDLSLRQPPLPGKPVACNSGLLSVNYGSGTVAFNFGSLPVTCRLPLGYSGPQFLATFRETWATFWGIVAFNCRLLSVKSGLPFWDIVASNFGLSPMTYGLLLGHNGF